VLLFVIRKYCYRIFDSKVGKLKRNFHDKSVQKIKLYSKF